MTSPNTGNIRAALALVAFTAAAIWWPEIALMIGR